jgi:hypothetical protein
MQVLLIESSPGAAKTLHNRLIRDGHEVVSCNDSRGGPCRGVEANNSCPLQNHIDVAILARRDASAPTLNEMGAVCADRHRVPVVELYPGDEFGPGESAVVAAALARRRVEAQYVMAIRHEMGHAVDDIKVEREHGRIHVTLTAAPSSSATLSTLADKARKAVREYDANVPVVDISVILADPTLD